MKKILLSLFVFAFILSSCGGKSNRKRNLDSTLYKYASVFRWSDYDAALRFLKPNDETIKPSNFELQKLKQFKVSQYSESPIKPGAEENIILQDVKIQLYNIHTNKTKTIMDHQSWEYDDELERWFITSGFPKL